MLESNHSSYLELWMTYLVIHFNVCTTCKKCIGCSTVPSWCCPYQGCLPILNDSPDEHNLNEQVICGTAAEAWSAPLWQHLENALLHACMLKHWRCFRSFELLKSNMLFPESDFQQLLTFYTQSCIYYVTAQKTTLKKVCVIDDTGECNARYC